MGSHLGRLQSTLGMHQSIYDMRKIESASPSKPIIPQLLLEIVWSENSNKYVYFKYNYNFYFHSI